METEVEGTWLGLEVLAAVNQSVFPAGHRATALTSGRTSQTGNAIASLPVRPSAVRLHGRKIHSYKSLRCACFIMDTGLNALCGFRSRIRNATIKKDARHASEFAPHHAAVRKCPFIVSSCKNIFADCVRSEDWEVLSERRVFLELCKTSGLFRARHSLSLCNC